MNNFTDSTAVQFVRGIDRSTIDHLDIPRYMGRWYEIARYDRRFERGMALRRGYDTSRLLWIDQTRYI